MHAWQEIAPHYGLEQRHHGQTTPGKNATDIALVVDAMDILYSGAIEHFCLVTSDSDYTPPGAAAPVCQVPGTWHWQTDDTSCLANGMYGVCFD
jgi:hypothetical protein